MGACIGSQSASNFLVLEVNHVLLYRYGMSNHALVQADAFLELKQKNETTPVFYYCCTGVMPVWVGSACGHCGCWVVVNEFVLLVTARSLIYKQNNRNGSH